MDRVMRVDIGALMVLDFYGLWSARVQKYHKVTLTFVDDVTPSSRTLRFRGAIAFTVVAHQRFPRRVDVEVEVGRIRKHLEGKLHFKDKATARSDGLASTNAFTCSKFTCDAQLFARCEHFDEIELDSMYSLGRRW